MRFPAKENAGSQKHCAISRQEEMPFSTPVGLPWDPPPPQPVRAGGRTYADVTTKISRIDKLPNPLTHALAGSAITHGALWYG